MDQNKQFQGAFNTKNEIRRKPEMPEMPEMPKIIHFLAFHECTCTIFSKLVLDIAFTYFLHFHCC